MNDNEVNKIIAEFMGDEGFVMVQSEEIKEPYIDNAGRVNYHYTYNYRRERPLDFCNSLDALVPVWKKLGNKIPEISKCNNRYSARFDPAYTSIYNSLVFKDTIHQAAAHATAKAILELKGNKDV